MVYVNSRPRLRAGWTIGYLEHWDLEDTDTQLEQACIAIMDGRVEEFAELDATGAWVGVETTLGRTGYAPSGPVTRHARRLPAWRRVTDQDS